MPRSKTPGTEFDPARPGSADACPERSSSALSTLKPTFSLAPPSPWIDAFSFTEIGAPLGPTGQKKPSAFEQAGNRVEAKKSPFDPLSMKLPGVETPSSTSSLREVVQAKASEIRHRAEGAQGNFDSKAEIIPTQDGTLASKKSLLKQTGKQVVNDGSASIGAAKDAVKDLLRRKN